MIYLLAIVWYLIGSLGGLYVARKIHPKTTIGDLVFFFTVGGICGVFTVLIAVSYLPKNNWWDKELF